MDMACGYSFGTGCFRPDLKPTAGLKTPPSYNFPSRTSAKAAVLPVKGSGVIAIAIAVKAANSRIALRILVLHLCQKLTPNLAVP
jgi:hypothetical protein